MSKPIEETAMADCLVLKRLTHVMDYGLEAARIALDSISDLKLTGRIEFLSGDLFGTGDYALCICFEPANGVRLQFDKFWQPLRDTVQKRCKTTGHFELQQFYCESSEVSRLREQFSNQGTFTFESGLPVALPSEEEVQSMWLLMAAKERERNNGKSKTVSTKPSPKINEKQLSAKASDPTIPTVSTVNAPFPENPAESRGKYGVQITIIKDGGGHAFSITPLIKKSGSEIYTGNGNPQFVKLSGVNAVDKLLQQIKDALDGKSKVTRLAK